MSVDFGVRKDVEFTQIFILYSSLFSKKFLTLLTYIITYYDKLKKINEKIYWFNNFLVIY